MPDRKAPARPKTASLLLCLLACASCLAGEHGRVLVRTRAPISVPEEQPVLPLPKSAATANKTPVPPLSLTSADGTALTLGRVQVRGFVDGPLALTELHLDFVHAEARTIEGRFEITLPPGAEISRFAMRVGNVWQEAEVVERQRARAVYETILHQGLDPALLEIEAGNKFSARVFPIGPNEIKQLIVSYTQELEGGEDAYVIPLRGLPKVPELEIEVGASGTQAKFERLFERHLAEEDLVVPLPSTQGLAFADAELAVARIVPVAAEGASAQAEPIESMTILFDTSASRAANFADKLARFASFCAALRKQETGDPKIVLIAFDQTTEVIYRGPLSGLGASHFERIAERRALGATDLAGALAGLKKSESKRLLLASDGVATAGQDVDKEALVKKIADAGFERVDVLIDGSVREQAVLERVAASGRAGGQIIELERTKPAMAASRVRRPSLGPVRIEVEGASWVSPREVWGMQPGDDVLVFARFDARPRSLRVSTREGAGKPRTQQLTPTAMARPLLERAMVSRRVRELVDQLQQSTAADPEWAALTRREIVELSTQHRVLTPYTAMLVLENYSMYQQFGLERDEFAPILAVGERGVTFRNARDPLPEPEPKAEPESWPDTNSDFHVQRRAVPEPELEPAPDLPPEPDTRESRRRSSDVLETKFKMENVEQSAARLEQQERMQHEEERSRLLELERMAESARQPELERRKKLQPEDYDFEDSEDPGEVLRPDGASISDRVSHDLENPVEEENPLASSREDRSENAGLAREMKTRPPRERPVRPARVELRSWSTSKAFELDETNLAAIDDAVVRCYDHSLVYDGHWGGRAELHVSLRAGGAIDTVRIDGAEGRRAFEDCLRAEASTWRFHGVPRAGWLLRRHAFKAGAPTTSWSRPSVPVRYSPQPIEEVPIDGRYAEVLGLLAVDERARALELAMVWNDLFPGDPLALLALGKALLAANRVEEAARAFGGIIDLHPSRADIRRFAGNLLESLPEPPMHLVIDCYERAVAARPDQPSSYRMLAMAQARAGALEDALETLERGLELQLPANRYAGVHELMYLDLQLLAGVWAAREPKRRTDALRRMVAVGGNLDEKPSLRFVVTWESDANDVDLHVRDDVGRHAFYGNRELPRNGGRLVADVVTGFGPEGFVVHEPNAFPYSLSVDYYSKGAMGNAMGQVQIVHHDGAGNLRFEARPFVVMREDREFDLGIVAIPTP